MKLYRANSDSYDLIIDGVSGLIQNKVILYLNKEHLNNYGYFIHDEEYYINLDFDFLELNDAIIQHINRIKSIHREDAINNLLN
jgi:hypothetical protein